MELSLRWNTGAPECKSIMTRPPILIIPAYKPDLRLLELVNQVRDAFAEVLVVDDGSGDDCRAIFTELQNSGIRVIAHQHNCGKGFALKTAFRHVLELREHYNVVTADADGQHLAEDILQVARTLSDSENALVLGCRDFKSAPFRNRFGNRLAALVFHLFTGQHPTDTQTGLRGIPALFLPEITVFTEFGYDLEARMLLAAVRLKYKIIEVPITTVYLTDGVSHFRPFRDSCKIAHCALRELLRK